MALPHDELVRLAEAHADQPDPDGDPEQEVPIEAGGHRRVDAIEDV
jgi:hypothetical protein